MKVVHIAGTNGKGSAAEYISQIIMATGQRCGVFTSPHLVSPAERMRINGRNIDDDTLKRLLEDVRCEGAVVNDTLFAAYTAAALRWFEQCRVDYAVIETGLGGRLDPTNVVSPSLTVLTPIDYDHMHLLGSTIEDIAHEKCGIVKQGVPVVSSAQHTAVRDIILEYSQRLNAPIAFADDVDVISRSLNGQKFRFDGDTYTIGAIGEFQPQNAVLAVLAVKTLGIDNAAVKKGLTAARLKCRTEFIKGTPDILVDGAHNTASADMLAATLDEYFADREKVLLFACMQDKDYHALIHKLDSYFKHVVITQADKKRGAQPEALAQFFAADHITEHDITKAFREAKAAAVKKDALLVVAGSFYLAGHVRHIIANN